MNESGVKILIIWDLAKELMLCKSSTSITLSFLQTKMGKCTTSEHGLSLRRTCDMLNWFGWLIIKLS